MRPIATGTQRGLSFCVCLSVWLDNKPCKNGKKLIEMPAGLWTRVGLRNQVLGGGLDPPAGEGAIWGVVPALKCIRLCKQQTPQQQGV